MMEVRYDHMGTKHSKYPVDLKKQVVELYFEGHSPAKLAEKYNIKNRRVVNEWVLKVINDGYEGLNDKRGLKSKGKKKVERQTLEKEMELLKLENEYLKKLLDLKRG
jgi:transposase-like protein